MAVAGRSDPLDRRHDFSIFFPIRTLNFPNFLPPGATQKIRSPSPCPDCPQFIPTNHATRARTRSDCSSIARGSCKSPASFIPDCPVLCYYNCYPKPGETELASQSMSLGVDLQDLSRTAPAAGCSLYKLTPGLGPRLPVLSLDVSITLTSRDSSRPIQSRPSPSRCHEDGDHHPP